MVAIGLGLVADLVCEMIFGDGPGFIPGALVYPALFALVMLLGNWTRRLTDRIAGRWGGATERAVASAESN